MRIKTFTKKVAKGFDMIEEYGAYQSKRSLLRRGTLSIEDHVTLKRVSKRVESLQVKIEPIILLIFDYMEWRSLKIEYKGRVYVITGVIKGKDSTREIVFNITKDNGAVASGSVCIGDSPLFLEVKDILFEGEINGRD